MLLQLSVSEAARALLVDQPAADQAGLQRRYVGHVCGQLLRADRRVEGGGWIGKGRGGPGRGHRQATL